MEHTDTTHTVEVKETVKTEDGTKAKDMATKTLAVIGLAGILALVSLGIVKFAPQGIKSLSSAAASLSSHFIPSKPKITLTSDKTAVQSGNTFNLSWSRNKDEEGSYSILYTCEDGVRLEVAGEGSNQALDCATEYSLDAETSISLEAFTSGNSSVDVPITINFTKAGSDAIADSADIIVGVAPVSAAAPIVTVKPSVTPSPIVSKTPVATPVKPAPIVSRPVVQAVTTQVPIQEDPNGKPDLEISIIAVGSVDRDGVFREESRIGKNDKAAVEFRVRNVGTKRSGIWRFESKLPTKASYTYNSGAQISLMPQDTIEFTLAFDQFKTTSTLDFTIKVDPTDDVDESNERNNDLDVSIRVNN